MTVMLARVLRGPQKDPFLCGGETAVAKGFTDIDTPVIEILAHFSQDLFILSISGLSRFCYPVLRVL